MRTSHCHSWLARAVIVLQKIDVLSRVCVQADILFSKHASRPTVRESALKPKGSLKLELDV